MSSIRIQRVADQIQEEISQLLLKGLKDPRIGFVTITGVDVTKDLRQAVVFFASTGDPQERDRSCEGLQSAAGFIHKALMKTLRLKIVPEITFRYDTSLDQGDRIERLLSEIREKEGWNDPSRMRGSIEEVVAVLRTGQRFLVTSHRNPDGDAVASVLAMGHLLRALGKEVTVYSADRLPDNTRFLPGAADVQLVPGESVYDATLVLDASDLARVSPLPPPERCGQLVGIDHHRTLEPIGKVHYVDPSASSVGELIERIAQTIPVAISTELATCIYTSILSDTGSFHYSNASPAALEAAARMLSAGVDPWMVALQVYESQPLRRVRLFGDVLQTLEISPNGQRGSIFVSQEMFSRHGASEADIDGFINTPRGIEGVEVAIQFREQSPGEYKVSFRSRGRVNVAEIGEHFGGGGHANAAGCSLKGTLEEVKSRIFEAVEQAIDK